jgi:chromosome partition protein MukE
LLEPFYRRYGCELIHKTDGYFYLLPTGDKVSRKQLSPSDMLVGQALALLYLDPSAVERGGVVSQEDIVGQLSAVLGSDALIGLFSPGKRKKQDERIAQRNVRQRVAEAVRRLAGLGFVELSEASAVRLRAALLRFAEPVRGLSEPAEALAKLVAQGEVALTPDGASDEVEDADEDGELAATSDEDPGADALEVSEAEHDVGVADAAASGDSVDALRATHETAAVGGESACGVALGEPNESVGAAAASDGDARPIAALASTHETGELAPVSDARAAEIAAATGDVAAGERALRDAWDESSGSGVVARPEAADARAAAQADDEKPRAPSASAPTPGRQFTPPADDDLDWANILLPGQDAEDGS